MPIELAVSIAYDNIYSDYETVNVAELIKDIPTKNALTLICHYTAQIHSVDEDVKKQVDFIRQWTNRFSFFRSKRMA